MSASPGQTRANGFCYEIIKMGGEDLEMTCCYQLFHIFRMTDNGVEMVGGESNNQGQVRDKVLFGAIKPLL